jgi:hypothetical protein
MAYRLATGLLTLKDKEKPDVRPEHPYARRSKGCKVTSTGRSPGLEGQKIKVRNKFISKLYFLPSSQWRDRAGFTPASLFSPLYARGTWTLLSEKNRGNYQSSFDCGADVITTL